MIMNVTYMRKLVGQLVQKICASDNCDVTLADMKRDRRELFLQFGVYVS